MLPPLNSKLHIMHESNQLGDNGDCSSDILRVAKAVQRHEFSLEDCSAFKYLALLAYGNR